MTAFAAKGPLSDEAQFLDVAGASVSGFMTWAKDSGKL